jgi:hypothetical protein
MSSHVGSETLPPDLGPLPAGRARVAARDQAYGYHDGARVRLISRHGVDWEWRFPTIVAGVEAASPEGTRPFGPIASNEAEAAFRPWERQRPLSREGADVICST